MRPRFFLRLLAPGVGSSRMTLLALLTFAASCEHTESPVARPQFSNSAGEGLKGSIAFLSSRDGVTLRSFDIYIMNADGTKVTRLTFNAKATGFPAWSPNGSQIAFDGFFLGTSDEIYTMNADGTGVTQLTNTVLSQNFDPGWCGDQIAFTSNRGGTYQIYVMRADGTGVTQLTNFGTFTSDPAWSPTCKQIAFASDRDHPGGTSEIYVMNADGTGVTRLTNNAANEDYAAWSPNGSQIAFYSDRDGNAEIYVMNADGTGVTRLTNNIFTDFAPGWSPDAKQIVFTSNRDGQNQIYVMNADGTGVTRITNDVPFHDDGRAWSRH